VPEVVVIILHPPSANEGALTALMGQARELLAIRHADRLARAGADRVTIIREHHSGTFGELLAEAAAGLAPGGGLVVLGAGAVPLLTPAEAGRLVEAARRDAPFALTNNRYSSDVCAISRAARLRALPPLPGDNALPRWLAEQAGYVVQELPGRQRLALDLDTPLDLALLALVPRSARELRTLTASTGVAVPRLEELRAVAADPRAELLVFGRASARGLAWLERHTACRVRFLAEERGLRASTRLAQAAMPSTRSSRAPNRLPRATLGRILAHEGPEALADVVGDLADGALLDSRVLLAHRLGVDETAWPRPEDRFASDLLRPAAVEDPWLRALTVSAATARGPILLGGHTLVGAGLRLVLGGAPRARSSTGAQARLR
jgi:CTP:molybdopterin cytidylyltransferase MocA